MKFRNPLVAGFAVAALMLSPLSAYAQETPAPEAPAAEAPATDAPADAAAAPAAADAGATQNWLKVCDPLPDGQQALIEKALAKSPDDRFQSAIELADAIQRVIRAQTT